MQKRKKQTNKMVVARKAKTAVAERKKNIRYFTKEIKNNNVNVRRIGLLL